MKPIPPTLLVLAAGLGSRYGGLKQMDPVGPNGETIIDYSIFDAIRAGFRKVVFVLRREMENAFRREVGARFENHIAVEYVFQELDKLPNGFHFPPDRTKPWGTTHAVLMAAGVIHDPFAVINADDFYGAESYRTLTQQLMSYTASDNAMVGFALRNTLSDFGPVARGICTVNGNGYLEHVEELTALESTGASIHNTAVQNSLAFTGDEIVSMNMWAFHPDVFASLQQHFEAFLSEHAFDAASECYLPATVNSLIHANKMRIKVLQTSSSWFGVTYAQDRAEVIEKIGGQIQKGAYPKQLWPEQDRPERPSLEVSRL